MVLSDVRRFMTSLASACLALSSAAAPGADSTPPALSASSIAVQTALLQPACACAVLGAFGEDEGLALGTVFDMVLLYLKVRGWPVGACERCALPCQSPKPKHSKVFPGGCRDYVRFLHAIEYSVGV